MLAPRFGRWTIAASPSHPQLTDVTVASLGPDPVSALLDVVIAGAGPDEPRLRRLAHGADVRFAGRLAPEDLAGLRRRAAVALAPSRWEEPCPYSVLEALAAGVPVLASARGGLPEMVGSGAGLSATDHAAWSAALSELWRNPRLREQQGNQAIAWARDRHGEERYYAALTRLYDGVSP